MSGLTDQGFVAKRLPELKTELDAALIAQLGDLNLHPASVFGQLVGLTVDQQADFWGRLEQVYSSQYPSSATGVNLDRVASINGLTRLPELATQALGTMSGLENTTIAAGRLVANSQTGQQYTLLETVTIDADNSVGFRVEVLTVLVSTNYTINLGGVAYTYNSGVSPTEASILNGLMAALPAVTKSVTINDEDAYLNASYGTSQPVAVSDNLRIQRITNYGTFAATQPGPIQLAAGAMDQIITPVAGWFAVNNRNPGSPGRYRESDTDFRLRRAESLKLAGTNTLDSIVTRLRQLPGVLALRVAANNTSATNAEGIPAHSIRAIVDGGTNEDVARALYDYVAAGVGYYGAITVNVVSEVTGTPFAVKFDRPVNVELYITVVIEDSPDTPTDVINYVHDKLMAEAAKLQIGEPVLYTRLFGPITSVIGDGAYVKELYINTVPIDDPADELTANLVPNANQRYVLARPRIQVFVT